MSVTWNSSKHSSQASSAISAAASWIGSSLGDVADLHFLPIGVHALVHVGHELVEMRAALAHHRAGLEEQVHQHGLAAADLAVDVEALAAAPRAFALPNSQPSDDDFRASRCWSRRCASAPSACQHLLAGIALDLSGGDSAA